MKNFYKVILLLFLISGSAFSYDIENGKDLYLEAKCQKCHTAEDFRGEDRKVNDFAKLQWRVKRCDFTMGSGWFDEDIEDVTNYLNDEFYKFEISGKK